MNSQTGFGRLLTTTSTMALAIVLAMTFALVSPGRADVPVSFDDVCNRAATALAHGRLDQAEQLLTHALALANSAAYTAADPTGRRTAEQARVRLQLAQLQRLQGDTRQARHELGLARFATRSQFGPDSLMMADIEIERARQHQMAGLDDEAVAAVETALRIRSERLSADDPRILDTLQELARARHLAFQYVRTIEAYDDLLTRLSSAPNARSFDQVVILNRMAWIFERAGLTERAEASRARARAVVSATSPGGGTSDRLLQVGLEDFVDLGGDHVDTMAEARQRIANWLSERGVHPDHFDLDRHQLVTLRRLDRGVPRHKALFALERDLEAEFIAFAPATRRTEASHRYGLPFESEVPRQVLQTSEGAHGFDRVLLHAVDFAVPAGTTVVAARDGVVVRVITGLPSEAERDLGPQDDTRHGRQVNRVIVLHDDDTYATYQPLSPDVEVAEGEPVVRGQRLGKTTHVNDGGTPMLHLDVRRNGRSPGSGGIITPEPVRVRFANVGDRDGIPLPDHYYGGGLPASQRPAAR